MSKNQLKLLPASETIEILKTKLGVTDEELAQKAAEIKQRFGPVVETDDFLYYLIAKECYSLDLQADNVPNRKKTCAM